MAVFRLLGSEVVCGAQHLFVMLLGQAPFLVIIASEGQAEIEDLDGPLDIENQVCRLDVAVDKALIMGVLQAEGSLTDVFHRLTHGQHALFLDLLLKVDALDVIQHDVPDVTGVIEVCGPGDVGVVQPK